MSQADGYSRQTELDLPPMPVTRKSQRYTALCSLGKNFRTMGKQQCGDCGIESVEGGFEVGMAGTKVIDSSHGETTLPLLIT